MSVDRNVRLFTWAVIGCVAAATRLQAAPVPQDDHSDGRTPPLAFRQLFIPEGRLPEWPTGGRRYLPLDAREFERLLTAAHLVISGSPTDHQPLMREADYQATLTADDSLEGTARLQIDQRAPSAAILALEPCSLSLTQPRWGSPEGDPAIIGQFAGHTFGLLADRSGMFHANWSVHGHRDTNGDLVFPLALPAGPVRRLQITLPQGHIPTADHGIVRRPPESDGTNSIWQIELGSQPNAVLKIISESANAAWRRKPVVRQLTTYDVMLQGAEITSQWVVAGANAVDHQLRFLVDPAVRITAARIGDVDVPWSVTRANSDPRTRLSVHLHRPLANRSDLSSRDPPPPVGPPDRDLRQQPLTADRPRNSAPGVSMPPRLPLRMTGAGQTLVVNLHGVARLDTNCRWQLPQIDCEGVAWESGQIRVFVTDPLAVRRLELSQCRQIRSEPIAAPGSGESLEFEAFAQAASVAIDVARPEPEMTVQTGTTLVFGAHGVTGRVVAECITNGQESHTFAAQVASGWVVEAVETDPGPILANWSVSPAPDGTSALAVQFGAGLPARQPVRLIVSGRIRRSALDHPLRAATLRFLQPTMAAARGLPLMVICAADPFELHVEGDTHLRLRNPADLSAQEATLIEDPLRGLLFDADWNVAQLQVGIVRKTPQFTAEIDVDVTLIGESIEEKYRIRCVPDASRLSRLTIGFAQAIDPPLRVTLVDPDHQELAARPVAAQPSANNGSQANGQLWEVSLPRVFSTPFELEAVQVHPRTEPIHVNLASTPRATSQRGRVAVHATSTLEVVVAPHRLEPIPLPNVPPDAYVPVRAVFRYEPARSVLATTDPILTLRRAEAPQQPQAWIWRGDIESRSQPSGTTFHRVTYHIENRGQPAAVWTIPPNARLQAAWLDGVKLPQDDTPDGLGKLHVDLPLGRRFPKVVLELIQSDRRPGVAAPSRPAVPQSDLPIISSQWTLWLRPGIEVAHGDIASDATPLSTVRKRLFGPLAPAAQWKPFDPFHVHDWARLMKRRATDDSPRRAAEWVLEHAATVARRASASHGPPTWGDLLSSAARDMAPFGIPLLVDRTEFARQGITPFVTLPRVTGRPPAGLSNEAIGAALLDREGLELVVQPAAILLTTAPSAAQLATALIAINQGIQCRYRSTTDGLAATAADGAPRWVGAADWSTQRSTATLPWSPSFGAASVAAGWSAVRWQNVDAKRTQATVFSRWAHGLAVLAACALFASVVWRTSSHVPTVSIVLLAVISSAALLLPDYYASIATGGFLGTLLGLAWGTRHLPATAVEMTARDGTSPSRPSPPPAATAGLLLAGLFVGLTPSAAPADEPSQPAITPVTTADTGPTATQSEEQAEPQRTIPTVLVPTDTRGRRVGSKVYVPSDLLAALQRYATAGFGQPHDWVLTGAAYEASISTDRLPRQYAFDTLAAVFDLQIFNRLTTVNLPLRVTDPAWIPGPAWLDGQPIGVAWPAGGSGCQVEVKQLGPCQLVIHMRRRPGEQPPGGFVLAIPPLASSRLRLTVPDRLQDLGDLHLPVPVGAAVWDRQTGRIDVALGPVGRLAVGRPGGADHGAAAAEFETTELFWLNIQPGTVILSAKHKVTPRSGKIEQLQFTADPRLQLLPNGADSPIESAKVEAGVYSTVTLQLKRPSDEPQTIVTRWLVTGYSGIGNLRMPHLAITSDRPRRRLLAVSVAPALIAREDRRERLTALAVADFTREWGDVTTRPQFVYQLPDRTPIWSLATWPRSARVEANETLAIGLDRAEATVRYEARLTTAEGYRFQYHLAAPQELVIENISVLQQDALQPVRWACDDSGRITLFLSEPLTGEAIIALRGRLPIPVRGGWTLPELTLDAARVGTRQLRIYQRDSVLATVTARKAMVVVKDAQVGIEQRGLGRLVGAFSATSRAASATLTLSPNRPQLTGKTVTTIRWNGDVWQADFDYFFDVTEGQVEQIRLDVPAWWKGPFRIDPPATVRIVEVPGRNRRRLMIRPRNAISGQYHLHLAAALTTVDDQQVRVPHIATLNHGQVERFLVLPTRLDRQQLIWTTRGLQPAELPASLALPDVSRHTPRVVRVVRDPFEAVPQTLPEVTTAPQIRLADIRIVQPASGLKGCGLASYDLVPASLTSCLVQLPPHCDLTLASVEGYPAEARQLDDRNWQLMLHSATLPQRVDILFRTSADQPEGWRKNRPWQAPVLAATDGPIPVTRTLWTVSGGPASRYRREAVRGLVDARHQVLTRLAATDSVLDLPREITDQVPLEQRVRWYRGWARRLQVQLRAARRQPAVPTVLAGHDIDRFAARQTAIAERLGTTAALNQIKQSPLVAREPPELFDTLLVPDVASARFAFADSHLTLELPTPWRLPDGLANRLAAVALILVAAAVAMLCVRGGRYQHVTWGWPHSMAVAGGLTWWLWLRPSAVGWLPIVGVTLWTLYRGRRAAPQRDSE